MAVRRVKYPGAQAFPPFRQLEAVPAGHRGMPALQKDEAGPHVCKNCGYYDGQEIIKMEEDKKKAAK
jgi:hypothetical protein